MNIKQLIKEAHDNAVEKGFYDCPICEGKESLMPDNGREKCSCWETAGINPNRNIGELLMLIVSELGEALEAHRKNRFAFFNKTAGTNKDCDDWNDYCIEEAETFERIIKDTFEDELADVFIRLADLCGYLEIKVETYPNLEMECFKNIGQELLWWTAILSDLPCFIEYYKENDITKEIRQISLLIKRMEIFCKSHNIDIEKHIEAKMAYNKTRPIKHGKEY